MTKSLGDRLRKAGIRHYDEQIHEQDEDWLVKNFKAEGATPSYPMGPRQETEKIVR